MLQSSDRSAYEIRNHFLCLRPEQAIAEIGNRFLFVLNMDESMSRHVYSEMARVVPRFCKLMAENKLAAALLHLAVCASNTVLQETSLEMLAGSKAKAKQNSSENDKPPPNKGIHLILI